MATLRYPNEIINSTTDWFRIGISAYNAGGQTTNPSGETVTTFLGSGAGTETEYIILPMPSNIQDGNSVSYGEDKLSTFSANLLSPISNIMDVDLANPGTYGKMTSGLNEMLNLTQNDNVRQIIKRSLAAEALSIFGGNVSIDSLLARESGTILNPNMELLFNGVTLRTFRFSFKMTPRDNTESDNIKKIIWTLKKNMAAKGGGGQDFLNTPNVFNLSYKKGSNDHPFLHKFRTCFLKDMSVNYTGENVYATYSEWTPVSRSMDLTFQEMVPMYEGDYGTWSDSGTSESPQTVGY